MSSDRDEQPVIPRVPKKRARERWDRYKRAPYKHIKNDLDRDETHDLAGNLYSYSLMRYKKLRIGPSWVNWPIYEAPLPYDEQATIRGDNEVKDGQKPRQALIRALNHYMDAEITRRAHKEGLERTLDDEPWMPNPERHLLWLESILYRNPSIRLTRGVTGKEIPLSEEGRARYGALMKPERLEEAWYQAVGSYEEQSFYDNYEKRDGSPDS